MVSVLHTIRITLSQLTLPGVDRLITFKHLCHALEIKPIERLFQHFYIIHYKEVGCYPVDVSSHLNLTLFCDEGQI